AFRAPSERPAVHRAEGLLRLPICRDAREAAAACRSWNPPWLGGGREHALHAAVLLVRERLVRLGCRREGEAVRDDPLGVDAALANVLQKMWHVASDVALVHPQRDALVHRR